MSYILKDLDYSLRDEISKIKEASGNISAATSFLSMYMWRNVYGDKIVCQDGFYSLKLKGEENTWFFPTGNREAKLSFIEEKLKEGKLKLVFVTDNDVEFVNDFFSDIFDIKQTSENSEYLYSVEEYRTLAGGKFKKLRADIKKTDEIEGIECHVLTEENAYLLDDIMKECYDESNEKGVFSIERDSFDINIFKNLKENGISGIVITVKSKPVAAFAGIIIGGKSFSAFYGEHIKEYDGLVAYCMKKIISVVGLDVDYINLEEDLGIEGLRLWKNKLHPIKIINMWECIQK